jgi:hypothetical protein
VFFINLPIAATILFITARKVPETRNPSAGRLDLRGAVAATLGFAGLVFGLIEAPVAGWANSRVWAPLAGGVVALVVFAWIEAKSKHPMVPLRLFRIRNFAGANLLTLFLYAALAATFFLLPFELIQARGYSPSGAGAAMLPLIVLISSLSRPAGALADRIGPHLPLTVGPAVAAVGFLLLSMPPADHFRWVTALLPALIVLGLGMATTVAPLTATVLNSVSEQDTGLAAGINNAVARVAGLVAIAAFGAFALRFEDHADHQPDDHPEGHVRVLAGKEHVHPEDPRDEGQRQEDRAEHREEQQRDAGARSSEPHVAEEVDVEHRVIGAAFPYCERDEHDGRRAELETMSRADEMRASWVPA